MRVSVFGLGYVGCVSAACLAHNGHEVTGVDVNPLKVETMGAGRSPIIETGLDDLVAEGVQSGRLRVALDTHAQAAICGSEISVICVRTPSNDNGSLNLDYVENVCRQIGTVLAAKRDYHVVVIRSTVLPCTVEERLIPILEHYSGKRAGTDFGVCMNPEFLREGTAIDDYYHPSFIVIGEIDQRSGDAVQRMYEEVDAPVMRTNLQTAEMVKYVSNAYHALKVVFANEIGALCKVHGIDGHNVMEIFCQDRQLNISPAYLKPGFAFGGSCLPKDVRALLYRGKERDVDTPMLASLMPSNQRQVQRGIELVEKTGRKKVGVLGLSFKAGTDDVRESPMVSLVETLVGRGYEVSIYDGNVVPDKLIGANKSFLERELPHIASLMRSSIDEVVSKVEVVVIANGSAAFRQVPQLMNENQVLVDLVGIARRNGSNGSTNSANNLKGAYSGIGW